MEELYRERLVRIDKAVLRGSRPRSIGYNARIPTHGPHLSDPVVRLHTSGGGLVPTTPCWRPPLPTCPG